MPIYDYVMVDFESEGRIHNSIDVKIEDLSVLSSLTNAHNIVKPWLNIQPTHQLLIRKDRLN